MKIRVIKYLFFLLTLPLIIGKTNAQILSVPPRSVSALDGDQVVSAITNLTLHDREVYILNEVLNGNVPNFYRTMTLVKDSSLISGSYRVIEYYVIPDYLALGHDTNYYLCPMTPILAQRLADSLNCMLPTRKMVNQIWTNANLHLTPQTIAPSSQMTTVPVMNDHNTMVWSQRQPLLGSYPLGTSTGGDKKDVVISNQIYTLAPPARVLIYGWHQTNGSPIQPLYGGHINTYADYSHGIRFVQKQMWLDGVPTQASTILNDATLNVLLSDEGVISQAFYPDTASTTTGSAPAQVKSFAVLPISNSSINIKISNNTADSYQVYQSIDGITFTGPTSFTTTDFNLTGLNTGTTYYVKIIAVNSFGSSAYSEVLGTQTGTNPDSILIVNGFDRASTGNTYDFIIEHSQSIMVCANGFASATNDAVVNGIVSLNNFNIVDYILGEESTADETFSSSEQNLVRTYVQNGGNLLVSGSEIGWDLDHMGSTSDQNFYHNVLQAGYIADAPNSQSGIYYEVTPTANAIFDGLPSYFFDDGTHGTYNVNWPDAISPLNGAASCSEYTNTTSQFAGIQFSGIITGGNSNSKIVNLGVPLETIYPASARDSVFCRILKFFTSNPIVINPPVVSGGGTMCEGLTATMNATPQNGTINWYSDLGLTQLIHNGNTYTVTLSPGTYTFYATESYNGNESFASQISVTVNPKPVLTITPDTLVCIPTTINLSISGASGYLWNNGATTNIISVSPLSDTSFSVEGTNTFGCTSIASVIITTLPGPVSDFIASDTLIPLNPGIVTFTNNSQNSTTYYWDFGDGNTGTGSAPWNQYLSIGVYSVILISSNNNCPADTLIKTNYIHVVDNASVTEDQLPEFKTTLENSSQLVRVNSSINTTFNLTIIATSGAICKSIELAGSLNYIDISSLSKGVYLFSFTTNSNRQTIKLKL